MFFLAALAGVVIGVLSGMLGIGGGTMMVPLLRLGFGLPAVAATGTSLFAIIPTSLSGMVSHIRNGTALFPVGLACGLGGACLSPVGVLLASKSPSWLVMAATAAVIAYSSYTMLSKAIRLPKDTSASSGSVPASGIAPTHSSALGAPAPDPAPAPGPVSTPNPDPAVASAPVSAKYLVIGVFAGMVAGLTGGYVGLGGGFLMVPILISFADVSMKRASATSLVAMPILATPGVITQCMLGNVDFLAGLALVVGSIPGAILGANLQRKVPERTLRLMFGCMLLIMAVALVANEFLPGV